MKAVIRIEKEVNLTKLEVEAHVRYWEDAEINGISDEDGSNVPFKKGESWSPVIDLDTGIIDNWPEDKEASIHFKVCDQGCYYLIDEDGNKALSIEDDYVPSIMSPTENGYGDYIIMDIDKNGQIADWIPNIDDFKDED